VWLRLEVTETPRRGTGMNVLASAVCCAALFTIPIALMLAWEVEPWEVEFDIN